MEFVSVCQFFIFFCILSASESALSFGPAEVNPNFPSSCWVKHLNEAVKVGEVYQEPKCVRASCVSYHGKLYVEFASCGSISIPEECTTVQDLSKPYPECCPQPSCDKIKNSNLLGPEYVEFKNWVETYYDYPSSEYA